MRADILRAEAERVLSAGGIHNARQEAGWLLSHVLGMAPLRVSAGRGREVDSAVESRFRALVARRVGGEPLQYVLGTTEFYGLELVVGPGVLIPRPETERLVDFALAAYGGGGICDVCTGSGAIALALASELAGNALVLGIDLSATALGYACRNRERLHLPKVEFVQADLLSCVVPEAGFGLIAANPPYVSPAAYAALPAEVADHEPRLALYAEDDGLAAVRRLLAEARPRLAPGGVFLCEISSEQGAAAAEACRREGFAEVAVLRDYTGRDRVLRGRRP